MKWFFIVINPTKLLLFLLVRSSVSIHLFSYVFVEQKYQMSYTTHSLITNKTNKSKGKTAENAINFWFATFASTLKTNKKSKKKKTVIKS